MRRALAVMVAGVLAPAAAAAQADSIEPTEGSGQTPDEAVALGPIHLGFEPEELRTLGGAAHVIDAETLEEHGLDDSETIVQQVPGVQVRTEDGHGLRPNIGLRGTSSERSRKITLMEDGVLFGPAPYAAPAAYYFPLMTRMVGVEVMKGPATVLYGPQTVGGAINLLSRQVPRSLAGGVEIAGGTDLYRRTHAHIGSGWTWGGFLVEGAYVGSAGFKEIDGAPDASTGFDRGEVLGTLELRPGRGLHTLSLRGGASAELSRETYLGLTDADYAADPDRRYAASARDRMDWLRWELRARHRAELGSGVSIDTVAYRHALDRTWRKANRFAGADFSDVLAAPDEGLNRVFYDVLSGSVDSASPAETLLLGTNARSYVSQGVQTEVEWEQDGARAEHELQVGLRLHNDHIERDHSERGWDMAGGELVRDLLPASTTADNRDEATAVAGFVSYLVRWRDLSVSPGARVEHVRTTSDDRLADEELSDTQTAVLPGLGLHYAVADDWGVLAGVHRGFSPVSPGQARRTRPEYSVAYEAGVRYGGETQIASGEVVGFFNDYANLTSECSFSTGCDDASVGDQYNAGAVDVYGVEALGRVDVPLPRGWSLPISATYTLTASRFGSAFSSADPQLGDVERGDALPYVPLHQGRVELGARDPRFRVSVAGTFVGPMLEEAGRRGEAPFRSRFVVRTWPAPARSRRGVRSVRGRYARCA